MFSRSTQILRAPLRTPLARVTTPARSITTSQLLRNSTANASQSATDAQQARDKGEQNIYDKLKAEFKPKTLDVMDVSGEPICRLFWISPGRISVSSLEL